MGIKETVGDLFNCETPAVMHCVSRDGKMGAGIAAQFRSRYPAMCLDFGARDRTCPDVFPWRTPQGLLILNLITKRRYFEKPTYETLEASLIRARELLTKAGIREVAAPKIGCGLDGLEWGKVSEMLGRVFGDSGIEVTVYGLAKENEVARPGK
jgi:O-acetyl-ADP-ribose deacetylase (regulator of RNase III)